jgi:hypothetical protein
MKQLAITKEDLMELGYTRLEIPRVLKALQRKVDKGEVSNLYTDLRIVANDGDL